jgi:hypothetical protein
MPVVLLQALGVNPAMADLGLEAAPVHTAAASPERAVARTRSTRRSVSSPHAGE